MLLYLCGSSLAQGQLPYLDGSRNSPFAQLDFDEIYRQQLFLDSVEREITPAGQVEAGTVSALDMLAPSKAVHELNKAASLLRGQKAKEAIRYLQKAISIYPKFVSAHIDLGLAYFDLKDARAKDEFETASRLDDQFPVSFMYLGMMSLWDNDFAAADNSLEKAAFLSPKDPQILMVLAFAQNGDHKYAAALRTVDRIHSLDHHEVAAVHYIGAAAALSLHNMDAAKTQLSTYLSEEPHGPLSAVARQELEELERPDPTPPRVAVAPSTPAPDTRTQIVTFPNSPHLRSELQSVANSPDPADDPDVPSGHPLSSNTALLAHNTAAPPPTVWANPYTIRQAVDETALFLAVSEHGKIVNDLSLSDIQIRDDGKPPDRVLEFLPQSQLPLRLGVLIDTSGSVEHRLGFEQTAAKKFLDRVLNPRSDLAFVAGFDTEPFITQDFSNDLENLNHGIDDLTRHHDGTAFFDALHFACWKLTAYPDHGRVARVLVVLTDGEDNASHRSLKQAIDAATAAGITVYTFNTSEDFAFQSDANKVLQMIAQRTGGDSMYPRNMRDLEHYFEKLSDAIRNRYLIAYKPANFVPNGSYRTLKVTAAHDGRNLRVHVRKGYFARLGWNSR